jgi:hypothetical protein
MLSIRRLIYPETILHIIQPAISVERIDGSPSTSGLRFKIKVKV